jgi:hypothetical protein
MESVNQVSSYVNQTLNLINDNKVLSSVLGMLLVLYAALAAPKLPKNVVEIFDNSLFKLGYMFLVVYLASKNPSLAIISSVALFVTIQTLASHKVVDTVVDATQTITNKVSRFVDQLPIPLSPARAELVELSAEAVNEHYEKAKQAADEGNHELADAHEQEAIKEEIKMNSAIKAKQHMLAGIEALQNGDVETANLHKSEAEKQDEKVVALIKAKAHEQAAVAAEQEGDLHTAQAHIEEATKHKMKVVAMVNSEQENNGVVEKQPTSVVAQPAVLVPEPTPSPVPSVSAEVARAELSNLPSPVDYDIDAAAFDSLVVSEATRQPTKQMKCVDEEMGELIGYAGSDYANF